MTVVKGARREFHISQLNMPNRLLERTTNGAKPSMGTGGTRLLLLNHECGTNATHGDGEPVRRHF